MQAYGSSQLDAALLLMPVFGFLPGSDPRVKGTVEAIERELMPDRFGASIQKRTHVDDGLPPGEGVFLACSFWMVSSLSAIGRVRDAKKLFTRLLKLRNDLGLLSEEYDPGLQTHGGQLSPGPSRTSPWSTPLSISTQNPRTHNPSTNRPHGS